MPIQHARPSDRTTAVVRAQLQHFSGVPPEELHALRGAAPAELSAEAPHEIYTLGLDQVVAGTGLASARSGGWRYLLRQGGRTVASAQTMRDATGAPVFALFNSGPFVESTAEALAGADRAGGADAAVQEPRVLHVPALNAMALWLHTDDDTPDVVTPLHPVPHGIDADRTYTVEEYLTALRQVAERVPPVGPDDLTGG